MVGVFMHSLWITVWKQERLHSSMQRRRSAIARTTGGSCFTHLDRVQLPEEQRSTRERILRERRRIDPSGLGPSLLICVAGLAALANHWSTGRPPPRHADGGGAEHLHPQPA